MWTLSKINFICPPLTASWFNHQLQPSTDTYFVLLFVFETHTRRSSLEPFAVVRPGLVGLVLHHLCCQSSSARKRQKSVGKSQNLDPTRPEERTFGSPSKWEGRSSVSPRNLLSLTFFRDLVPVTKCEVGSFIPGQCQTASGRILYRPRRFSAAVNKHNTRISLTSVFSGQLAADLRAAQQAACLPPRYTELHVHH